MKKYKFLNLINGKIKSNSGNLRWKVGKWQKHDEKLSICNLGLHCSKTPYEAFSFVQGEVLAIVETKGKSIIEDYKECWSDMKIVKAYKWNKKDSIAFSIYAAELVIQNYEKEYPKDKRPRQAIKAAKKVLFRDTAKNRLAARSAAGLAAESAAWSAAESAARSAWSAARLAAGLAAESAARSAARSAAESAARSAWSAARSAAWLAAGLAAGSAAESAARSAWSAAYKKLGQWMIRRISKLKKI